MATQSIPFKLNDGLVYIEVEAGAVAAPPIALPDGERAIGRGTAFAPLTDEERPIGRGESTADEAARDFSKSISGIGTVAQAVMAKLTDMAQKPAEVNLEFGLKFKVDGNVVVASLSAEANYVVKMTWRFEEKPPTTPDAITPDQV